MSAFTRAAAALLTVMLVSLWLGGAVVSAAQTPSLGEIARREEARRKKVKTAAKVYTNKDLPKSAILPPTPPAAAQPAAPERPAEKRPDEPRTDTKQEEEVRDEAWWRKRVTAAREELQRNELAAEAFQSRVNALTTDFVNRDDPYQRAQIAMDRQKALGELERVKAEMVRIQQLIADIEEEARVAGVPPGWLR